MFILHIIKTLIMFFVTSIFLFLLIRNFFSSLGLDPH